MTSSPIKKMNLSLTVEVSSAGRQQKAITGRQQLTFKSKHEVLACCK